MSKETKAAKKLAAKEKKSAKKQAVLSKRLAKNGLKVAKRLEHVKEKKLRYEAKIATKDGKTLRRRNSLDGKIEALTATATTIDNALPAPVASDAEGTAAKPTLSKREKKELLDSAAKLYGEFESLSFIELEARLLVAATREERAFFRALLNLKLQIEQEKVVGEVLL